MRFFKVKWLEEIKKTRDLIIELEIKMQVGVENINTGRQRCQTPKVFSGKSLLMGFRWKRTLESFSNTANDLLRYI